MQKVWLMNELFDLSRPSFGTYLKDFEYPWEVLPHIGRLIREITQTLDPLNYTEIKKEVWAARSAVIAPNVSIDGPCIIGEDSELRPGAYIRGNVLIGRGSVLGNSCEFKNCILLDHVQVPHFSYVGDSILGNDCHFGAGVICSNFRQDHGKIKIHFDHDEYLQTDLRKMGAAAGDGTEVGCQAVLNPGTLLGKGCRVYPLSSVRRAVPAKMIMKQDGSLDALLSE